MGAKEEENKKLILGLFNGPPNEKGMVYIDPVIDLLAEDAKWWRIGEGQHAHGGYETKQQVAETHKNIEKFFRSWKPTIDRVIAEGDYVMVQLHAVGETAIGRPYRQHYIFLYEMKNGKIQSHWEYLDTLHAKEAFGF